MVGHKIPLCIWDVTYMRGRGVIHKDLGHAKYSLGGFQKTFTKLEAHAGMYERMVRYLSIEEDLQMEIKTTISHKNQSFGQWCFLSYEVRNKIR